MTEGLVLGAAVAAGLGCPLHMWWSHRRGRQAACCPPALMTRDAEIEVLRARQELLGALIAQHEAAVGAAAEHRRETADT